MQRAMPFAKPCDASSVGSTLGHSELGDESLRCWDAQQAIPRPAPVGPMTCFGTVVVNGMQMIRCVLPAAAHTTNTQVPANNMLLPQDSHDGVSLDVMFVVPHQPAKAYNWSATLTVTYEAHDRTVQHAAIELGSVQRAGGSCHVGHYIEGRPLQLSVALTHGVQSAAGMSPVERQLVEEVVAILENPRLNKEQGSLSSVLINNKAKESVLYDRVVGKMYGKSWSDFLRAHSQTFTVFYYTDADIREWDLAPHIKRSDARVHLTGRAATDVHGADRARCSALRAGEEDLKRFLIDTLSNGEVSQRDLLARLKHCKGFTDSLFPTSSLLLRFLSSHRALFSATNEPDQATRIALMRTNIDLAQTHSTAPSPDPLSDSSSHSASVMSDGASTPSTGCLGSPHACTSPSMDCMRRTDTMSYRHDPYQMEGFVYTEAVC